MGKYTDYIMKTAQDLLAVPSPSGFTHMAAEFVKKEFENLGYKPQITQKGAVLVKLGGKGIPLLARSFIFSLVV